MDGYKNGYLSIHPDKFSNPVEFCFTLEIFEKKFQNVVFVTNMHLYVVHNAKNIIVLNIFMKNTILKIMLNNLS
jgi:hypothetical protein